MLELAVGGGRGPGKIASSILVVLHLRCLTGMLGRWPDARAWSRGELGWRCKLRSHQHVGGV